METKDHKNVGIFLIKQITEHMDQKLKWAFLWGCMEPDYNLLTYLKGSLHGQTLRGHNYENAHTGIIRLIEKLEHTSSILSTYDKKPAIRLQKLNWYFRLGKLTHYVADSFTFPHNKEFTGSLSEHIQYEADLHAYMTSILNSDIPLHPHYHAAASLIDQLDQLHDQYRLEAHNYVTDCCYILNAVIDTVSYFTDTDIEWQVAVAA